MNDFMGPIGGHSDADGAPPRRPAQLAALVILLFVESLLVVGAAVYLLIELLVDTPQSYPSAIAILVLTIVAAVWVAMIAVHAWRGRQWVRGATVVWQVLQASVGVGSIQGAFARPEVGWPLIILAVIVLALLFTRPVIAATGRRDE